MCYLREVNESGMNDVEVDDMEVDPRENKIQKVGTIKIENETFVYEGAFWNTINMDAEARASTNLSL